MSYFEKYRDYSLISKLTAYILFFDAGSAILSMLIRTIRYGIDFPIVSLLCQAVPIIAGLIFLKNKHNDKTLRLAFAGVLVLTSLIRFIQNVSSPYSSSLYIFGSLVTLLLDTAFAFYYLGVIRPAGRKIYFIVMYAMIGVAACFSIFTHYGMSVSTYGMYALLAMYSYSEVRSSNSTMVYAGMIGTAYYLVYSALSTLFSLISLVFAVNWYLPGFFGSMNILLCLAMPLLSYDRLIPGEGAPFTFDISVLTNQFTSANGTARPPQPQQNNFDPMTGQPLKPQQNNFDPMTGQPLKPQQNNFDPMTGQPLKPQQNNFDPMTGQPINNNNNNTNS